MFYNISYEQLPGHKSEVRKYVFFKQWKHLRKFRGFCYCFTKIFKLLKKKQSSNYSIISLAQSYTCTNQKNYQKPFSQLPPFCWIFWFAGTFF